MVSFLSHLQGRGQQPQVLLRGSCRTGQIHGAEPSASLVLLLWKVPVAHRCEEQAAPEPLSTGTCCLRSQVTAGLTALLLPPLHVRGWNETQHTHWVFMILTVVSFTSEENFSTSLNIEEIAIQIP